jgi:acetyl-CoA carboxylase biotin carboxyl carrier protein
MALTDDDVREILRIIDESELDELSIETEGFSLHVLRASAGAAASSRAAKTPRAPREDAPAPTNAPEPAGSVAPESAPLAGLGTIESPMLGTFYRAESPGGAPFVEVGARVEPDTTVCIIEVMKMMNSVPAGVSGIVAEVCSENGELVEYGEPLFRVTPDE